MVSSIAYSQSGNVRINTTDPKPTIDVRGRPTGSSYLEGLIAPRLTGAQHKVKNSTADQINALVSVIVAAP